ncbi:MAG: AAA family ATPase [Heyndrickxia oleronia]|jgi:ABC-2 type transport system ATP-binding protein|uniref:AAA family ATPase n=1 Tax=Heyndrickxia oleronia TaxID=38875 RepID=UPI002431AFA7|nr:AAA family ATPase [Heyndrickxia oleronia]MCI1593498.1 AAA family ATPase [Heyndrickxia oleronia]
MEIINLNYKIKDRVLYNNLSLKFKEDKINVLFGPNGAGKSTLLDIMAGLQNDLKNCLKGFPDESDIAYQLQGVPFLTTLKGRDIYSLFVKCDHKYKRRKMDLNDFDFDNEEKDLLERLFSKKFGDMSGGERRWLIIMAVCSLDRKLYLFDEPINGIDPEYKEKVYHRLEKIAQRENSHVIMTSHQLHDLAYYNCYLYFLNHGKIEFSGTYNEFIKNGGSINPDESFKFLRKGMV